MSRNGSSRQWRKLRTTILQRDGYRCYYCGTDELLEVDHIQPVVKGGSDQPDNLITVCRYHNRSKGKRSVPKEYRGGLFESTRTLSTPSVPYFPPIVTKHSDSPFSVADTALEDRI
jgi:hypothetical protein